MIIRDLIKIFNDMAEDSLEECEFFLEEEKDSFLEEYFSLSERLREVCPESYDFKYKTENCACDFHYVQTDKEYKKWNKKHIEKKLYVTLVHGDNSLDVTYITMSKFICDDASSCFCYWQIENKNPDYYFRCDTFEELKEHVRENSDKYFP